jgi:hypothetical protein
MRIFEKICDTLIIGTFIYTGFVVINNKALAVLLMFLGVYLILGFMRDIYREIKESKNKRRSKNEK